MRAGILDRLERSKFRSSFHLSKKEAEYALKNGLEVIKKHAVEILEKRIRRLNENDGRQTPWKGHPVFVAQHATATCCRKCIGKWHNLPKEKELDKEEINLLADLIMSWIEKEIRTCQEHN